jgi:hypothetical protein
MSITTFSPLPAPAHPTMRVVCAWCAAPLRTVPCAPAQDGCVSHGICAACAARQFARDVTAESFARPFPPR